MILSVSICNDVEIMYDDECDDRPNANQVDATLTVIRLQAVTAWMQMPTILDADTDLNAVDLTETITEGDA